MSEIIKLQSEVRSPISRNKLCVFNSEVIDKPTKPLIHQEARFWLINGGEAKALIHGETVTLKKGSLVAVFPWEITEILEVKTPLQYYMVIYDFDSVNILIRTMYGGGDDYPKIFEEIRKNPEVKCNNDQYEIIKGIFSDLQNELGTEDTLKIVTAKKLSPVYVINKIISLILEFFRMQSNDIICNKTDPEKYKNEEILQYMYIHLNEDITAKSLSKIFYTSENTISRYIKRLTGLSVAELCHEMRIVRVSNYLLYTDLTVSELSEIVGYADASHLSKLFKARMGVKINDYRKTYQKIGKILSFEETKEIYKIISYIYKNHAENLTINQVSEKFNKSPVSINKILLIQVEKSFSDFLNYVRINHSCKLLLTTNKTIIDIAIDVGYENAKTFKRNFIKYKVMTPSDYRHKVWLQTSSLEDHIYSLE